MEPFEKVLKLLCVLSLIKNGAGRKEKKENEIKYTL